MVIMQCQADLLQIVAALQSSRRLARRLHRRKQQRNENADDRNDDQKFNQRKRLPPRKTRMAATA
jgi:hypothetical protein